MLFQVVDDFSGFIGAATERNIPLTGNHVEITKVASADSIGFKLTMNAVREAIPVSTVDIGSVSGL